MVQPMDLLFVLAACSHRPTTAAVPPPSPLAPCLDRALATPDPAHTIAQCVANALADPTCSSAWAESSDLMPSDLARIAAKCAPSVCPTLPDPPALCAHPRSPGDPAMVTASVAELTGAALVQQGHDPSTVVLLAGALPVTVTLRTALPEPAPEPADLRIGIDAEGRVLIDGQPVAAPDLASTLEALAADHDGALILADTAVPYSEVMALIDALTRAGIDRFALDVAPP